MGAVLKRVFSRENLPAVAVLVAAFAVRVGIGLTTPAMGWPDEIFQTLEQAHRLAFGFGMIPWEFRDGIRSWVLPAFFSVVMKVGEVLMGPPMGHLKAVTLVLSLVSLTPVWVAMRWAKTEALKWPWLAGVVVAGWYELIYFSNRALTEVMAAWALVLAVFLLHRTKVQPTAWLPWVTGALFGLVVGLRFHLVPALAVTVLFVTRKDFKLLLKLAAGGAAVFLVFGLVDWATWGTPFQSVWKNFVVNVVEKKSEFYGVSKWSEYLVATWQLWGWSTVPLLGTAALAWRRWPVLGVAAVSILVLHSALAHKEYRFLAPAFALLLVSCGLGVSLIAAWSKGAGVTVTAVLLAASVWGSQRFEWKMQIGRAHV